MTALRGWKWADLNDQHLDLIHQAEQTLGADYILAYQPDGQADEAADPPRGLQAADLTPSQLECLTGLETMIHAVIVAYAAPPSA